jgi:anti-anti-sigma regulatory factor
MKVKIDTKEKFHVISVLEQNLTANIAAELTNLLTEFLEKKIKNVIVKFSLLQNIDSEAAKNIAQLQQHFYEKSSSFVICELPADVEAKLDQLEILELLNVTPSESEAWDIVQMEEIERELLDDGEIEFNKEE